MGNWDYSILVRGLFIMADYDYKAGKKRVKEILDKKLEVIEEDKVPLDDVKCTL